MVNGKYYPRELIKAVSRALKIFPVVVVSGPRQSGKSTMIREEPSLSGREYITLDDLNFLNTAKNEPESLLSAAGQITIDEAQRAPEIFLAIKRAVDRKRVPGQFLLSGSANFLLLKNLGDSLAGRAAYFELMPFSAREISRAVSREPFVGLVFSGVTPLEAARERPARISAEQVLRGGFPPAVLAAGREYWDWFRAYEQTYLQRDVRELSQVADLGAFRTLLRLAALRTAQILNQSEIGRDAKLSAVTTGRYLSLLETSCVISRLPPYHSSRTKRLVKSPKIHLVDSGLAAFLCGVDELPPGGEEPLRGPFLETYVNQNLISILGAHLPDAGLFYWRVRRTAEVDFIIEAGNKVLAIEIKWASKINHQDWKGLELFRRKCPKCVAGILGYSGSEVVPLGPGLFAVPLGTLLS